MDHPQAELRRLARWYGLSPEFTDVLGRRRAAPPETILAALRSLGASIASLDDLPEAVRARRSERWRRMLPLCSPAWDGRARVRLRLPHPLPATLAWSLRLEDGGQRHGSWEIARLDHLRSQEVDGQRISVLIATLPEVLPFGVHRLSIDLAGSAHHSMLIAAPALAHGAAGTDWERAWGVFLPLYAQRSERDLGIGDLSDLGALFRGVRAHGARLAGTLPLLATFLDQPCDPSPYAPVSRLFWNELYIDPLALPEYARSSEARALVGSASWRAEIAELRALPLVDYRAAMRARRRLLEMLSREFFRAPGPGRREAFAAFLARRPEVESYASFRAVQEEERRPWRQWPAAERGGAIENVEDSRRDYHRYVQWAFEEQVQAIASEAGDNAGLYLDFPVGVHPDGYDAWREQALFIHDASVGAPPDAHFTNGQDWGFPPPHPELSRLDGHDYFRRCIAHHLSAGRVLRVDHVMSLWRLLWIPRGARPGEGIYARYPAEELIAVLALESHRRRALVVGEDLGTVPPVARPMLDRHGLRRMFILQRELDRAKDDLPLDAIPAHVLSGINTHDMPPFASWWRGQDIELRAELGLLDDAHARHSRERRAWVRPLLAERLGCAGCADDAACSACVLAAALLHLRRKTSLLVVNLEDLWQETEPQNVPGTVHERPNWRRKSALTNEALLSDPRVIELLGRIDREPR